MGQTTLRRYEAAGVPPVAVWRSPRTVVREEQCRRRLPARHRQLVDDTVRRLSKDDDLAEPFRGRGTEPDRYCSKQ
jgi:hypothetical protein